MARTKTKKEYPKKSAAERHAEARDAMDSAARALLSSEGWQAWARTRAAFHSYSWGNVALIAMQRPDATRVAGFHTWRHLDRHVRKGERGIRIMAPHTFKRDNADTGEEERGVYFVMVSVFDVSQTDGAELPEPPAPAPVTGDSHAGILPRLIAHAQTLGYAVSFEELRGPLGYCDSAKHRIVIHADQPANAKVRTLIHELAHAHGVSYTSHTRGAAEVIVETVAWIVAGAAGLDTSDSSVPYVAGWGEGGDIKAIREHAETVDKIARVLETAIGLHKEQARQESAAA